MNVQPIFLSAEHLPKMKSGDKKLCGLEYPSSLTELGLHLGRDARSLEMAAQTGNISSVELIIKSADQTQNRKKMMSLPENGSLSLKCQQGF